MTKTMLSLMFGCHSLKRTAVDVLSGTAQRSQKSSSTKLYFASLLVLPMYAQFPKFTACVFGSTFPFLPRNLSNPSSQIL